MDRKVLASVVAGQCLRQGSRVAIQEAGGSVSYQQLGAYCQQVAGVLLGEGLGKGDVVGVYLPSGSDYVASIVGINQAGGLFMPLERDYPLERLLQLLKQVQPPLLLTSEALRGELLDKLGGFPGWLQKLVYVPGPGQALRVEAPGQALREGRYCPREVGVSGEDSNYLLYTSGSTGQPKIIEGSHKGLSHFIHWQVGEFGLDEQVRVGQLVPLSFDVSLRDIFVPLVSGGCLVVPPTGVRGEGARLLAWLREQRISLLHTVPSVLRLLLRELAEESLSHESLSRDGQGEKPPSGGLPHLRLVLLAGEALYGRDVQRWRQLVGRQAELVNVYGPSETTLAKVFNRIGEEVGEPNAIIPLGVPIANTSVLILKNDALCDINVIGEIYIRTPFRSKGYYRNPALTLEKFVQNPLHNDYEDIVYKTGDFGRYLKNRSIGFVGRQDGQLKVRGNRVEVSEVETTLLALPGIEQVVVTGVASAEGDTLLCCYYRGSGQAPEAVQAHLQKYLPRYMHPSYYVRLEEFPLSLNGKIDRKALLPPQELLYAQLPYQAPQPGLQSQLARIWSQVLGLERVGATNSFFELGGHSLSATKVVSRIYKELGREVSLKDFFEQARLDKLAQWLEGQSPSAYRPIEPLAAAAHYPLSPAQYLLWVLQERQPGLVAYNLPCSCVFGPELQPEALARAYNQVVNRHESLRTGFVLVQGEPRQQVSPPANWPLPCQPADPQVLPGQGALSQNPDREQALIDYYLVQEFGRSFELDKPPLVRAKLLVLPSGRYLFLCTMHHIISDGWSVGVFLGDMLACYQSYCQGRLPDLPALPIQYRDYVGWQAGQGLERQRAYWQGQLGGALPRLELPTDFPRPPQMQFDGDKMYLKLSRQTSGDIRLFCEKEGYSLFMVFLALIKVALYRLSGQTDLVVGNALTGRNHLELENQIGYFVNLFVLRTQVNRNDTLRDYLGQVRQRTLEAYEHQVPFGQVVEDLDVEQEGNHNPLFDVLVVLNNAGLLGKSAEVDQLKQASGVEDVVVPEGISKFDLTFFISDFDEIEVTLEYNTGLFRPATIEKIKSFLQVLTGAMPGDAGLTVNELAWRLSDHDEQSALAAKIQILNEDF